MATTTTYSLKKPTVGGSTDTWGADINDNLDTIDALLDGTTAISPKLSDTTGSEFKVGTTAVTATGAELNYLDITTLGTSEDSKAVTQDASGTIVVGATDGDQTLDIASHDLVDGGLSLGGTLVTASAAELNALDGIPTTLTATELGYVDGVTSSIQTQLGNKETADSTILKDADVGTTANKLVKLDGSAKLPAVDGSALTGMQTLSAGTGLSLTSGTLDVTMFDTSQAWTTVSMGSGQPQQWAGTNSTPGYYYLWSDGGGDGYITLRTSSDSDTNQGIGYGLIFLSGSTSTYPYLALQNNGGGYYYLKYRRVS